jgi:putative phosphoesterase
MCVFIFSDLHGNITQLKKVVTQIKKEKATHVIFSGDMGIDRLGYAKDLIFSLKQELTIVRGNVDQPWLFMSHNIRIPLLYTSINFTGKIIAITHGDYVSSWQDLPLPLTENDIFITGHTHVPHLRKISGQPIELNPGSVSDPRSSDDPSYAIITKSCIQIKSLETGIQIKPFIEYF